MFLPRDPGEEWRTISRTFIDWIQENPDCQLVPERILSLPCGCVRHIVQQEGTNLGIDRVFTLTRVGNTYRKVKKFRKNIHVLYTTAWIHKECGKTITVAW